MTCSKISIAMKVVIRKETVRNKKVIADWILCGIIANMTWKTRR